MTVGFMVHVTTRALGILAAARISTTSGGSGRTSFSPGITEIGDKLTP